METIKTKESTSQNGKNGTPDKNYLYNLLFAGKITLKEYMQAAKDKN